MSMSPDEYKMFNFVGQTSHLGCSAAIILALHLFVATNILWWIAGGLVLVAAWKEFYYDEKFETPVIRGSSLEDFFFYVAGMMISMVLIVLSGGA